MKATKKLIGASAALVAALAVSVGSTFAWFTNRSDVEVKGISAQVISGDSDLQVAVVDAQGAGTEFGYTLNLADVGTYVKLRPLSGKSSPDTDKDGLKLYDREGDALSESEVTFDPRATTGSENKFIQFYLAFRSTTASKEIVVDLTKSAVTANADTTLKETVKGWTGIDTDAYGTSVSANGALSTRAAYATRVAFMQGTKQESENMTLAAKGVWKPNEAADGTNTTGTGKGFWKGNLAKDYEKHLRGITDASLDAIYTEPTYTALDATTPVVTLGAVDETDGYAYGYLAVRIWLEGTDGDCFNYILSDKFDATLAFKIKAD